MRTRKKLTEITTTGTAAETFYTPVIEGEISDIVFAGTVWNDGTVDCLITRSQTAGTVFWHGTVTGPNSYRVLQDSVQNTEASQAAVYGGGSVVRQRIPCAEQLAVTVSMAGTATMTQDMWVYYSASD